MYLKPTKNGNKAKGKPLGIKAENNFKPCINRPLRITAYMYSLDMDHLLLTNLFNLYEAKIMMKTKNRITIFAKEMCILSIKDASKYKKAINKNWVNWYIFV